VGSIPARLTMNYNILVQQLNNPKPVYKDEVLVGHTPPTSLELQAARAIVTLQQVIEGLTRSNNTPAEEVKNEDLNLQ
jgi:hypothetical protein